MGKNLVAIGTAFIIAGVLAAMAHGDDVSSRFQAGLSSTSVSGAVQLNTLELVDNVHHFHRSGIAGQVLLVPELIQGAEVGPYQTTLSVYAVEFYLDLPPGTYVITPLLPQWDFSLSTSPVTVKVNERRITPVEIDVFELGGVIIL
jgi:hypothetical protein